MPIVFGKLAKTVRQFFKTLKTAPLFARIGCGMVWAGSFAFYNLEYGELVKSLAALVMVFGGFMVFITKRNASYRKTLVGVTGLGFFLGFLLLLLRSQ
jgi:hypothetical protein